MIYRLIFINIHYYQILYISKNMIIIILDYTRVDNYVCISYTLNNIKETN